MGKRICVNRQIFCLAPYYILIFVKRVCNISMHKHNMYKNFYGRSNSKAIELLAIRLAKAAISVARNVSPFKIILKINFFI